MFAPVGASFHIYTYRHIHQRSPPFLQKIVGCFAARSSRGERPSRASASSLVTLFLSTLPARGATLRHSATVQAVEYFYPRSPRGERLAPAKSSPLSSAHFYPRSPRGERPSTFSPTPATSNFYPRSPRGERPRPCIRLTPISLFLSTLPARGATAAVLAGQYLGPISIHAPREGSDPADGRDRSRLPISIHAPREGSDLQPLRGGLRNLQHFYPRSPRGERQGAAARRRQRQNFYPRSPRGERRATKCKT